MKAKIDNIAQFLASNAWGLFLFYALLTILFYRNTSLAGLVFDFNGWASVYEQQQFKDAFNSFAYPGLHQLEQIVFYTLYKLFKFNGVYWYLLFSLLHALSALLGYKLILSLFQFIGEELSIRNVKVALLSSLFFLLSPYAADVVVSKVTVHYLMSAIFIFSCLIYFLQYLQKLGFRSLLLSCFFFLLALFSLELSYLIPFAIIFLTVFQIIKRQSKLTLLQSTIPYLLVFSSFLILHRWVVGSFIGHYGAEVHTRFDIGELVDHFFYYFNSYVLFYDFWDFRFKMVQQDIVRKYWWVLLMLVSFGIGIGVYLKWHGKRWFQSSFLFLGMFSIALLPVLNMFCVRLQEIESDRYSYLASIFIYAFMVNGFFFLNSKVKYAVFIVFLFTNIYFLQRNIEAFEEMGIVSRGLLDDFRWEDKAKIIILMQPENNHGARAFTTIKEKGSEFAESLYLERGIDLRDKVELVYEMNINSIQDSIKIQVIDSTHVRVEIGGWGTWFWKYHNGALPFQTQDYHTEMQDNLSFDLILEHPLKEDEVIIYAHGDKWRELNF